MEGVVDTNVLIHDTIEDSEFHEAAASDLGRLDRWLVPTVVIEEYVSILWKLGLKKGFVAAMGECVEMGMMAYDPDNIGG